VFTAHKCECKTRHGTVVTHAARGTQWGRKVRIQPHATHSMHATLEWCDKGVHGHPADSSMVPADPMVEINRSTPARHGASTPSKGQASGGGSIRQGAVVFSTAIP
jgi:hypothetical protein